MTHLRTVLAAVGRFFAALAQYLVREVDLGDLVLIGGLATLGYGLSRWSIPLACICVGALLVGLAWPEAPREAPPERRRQGD